MAPIPGVRYKKVLGRRHPDYDGRLRAVADGIAAGKRHRDIAAELGISRQRVTQLAELLPVRPPEPRGER